MFFFFFFTDSVYMYHCNDNIKLHTFFIHVFIFMCHLLKTQTWNCKIFLMIYKVTKETSEIQLDLSPKTALWSFHCNKKRKNLQMTVFLLINDICLGAQCSQMRGAWPSLASPLHRVKINLRIYWSSSLKQHKMSWYNL